MNNQTKLKSRSKDSDLEKNDLKNQLARALADYDNLRKRVEVEKETWVKFAAQEVVFKLLPVLDGLESAQSHLNDRGIAIVVSEFRKILEEEGIEEVRPNKADNFDPNLHEAVELISGGKSGKIAEVILPGWKFNDGRIIRVAKVKVYGE